MVTGALSNLSQKRTRTLMHPHMSKVLPKLGYPVLFGTFNTWH